MIVVKEGQTVTVGRTTNSAFALPQDTFLSRVHFAVECTDSACHLVDQQSANGTLLNGVKVSHRTAVNEGDVILAGQTKFIVHVSASPSRKPAPASAQAPVTDPPTRLPLTASSPPVLDSVAVGSWFFGIIPEGWQVVEGFGLRRRERNSFPAEAMVSEATLASGQTFDEYIHSQLDVVRLLVSQPQIQAAEPPTLAGAEEARAFVLRYKMDDGRRFLQRQIYARSGQRAGSLALTTLESEAPAIQPYLDQILRGLAFRNMQES
jgi:pSer/pThr/pTyr-binding forkhead associated (FHA) protein